MKLQPKSTTNEYEPTSDTAKNTQSSTAAFDVKQRVAKLAIEYSGWLNQQYEKHGYEGPPAEIAVQVERFRQVAKGEGQGPEQVLELMQKVDGDMFTLLFNSKQWLQEKVEASWSDNQKAQLAEQTLSLIKPTRLSENSSH